MTVRGYPVLAQKAVDRVGTAVPLSDPQLVIVRRNHLRAELAPVASAHPRAVARVLVGRVKSSSQDAFDLPPGAMRVTMRLHPLKHDEDQLVAPSPFPRPVESSVVAFAALAAGMAAGLVLAAAALLSLPPLLVTIAGLVAVAAVLAMAGEAWRVSRRTGRGWWRSLGVSLRSGTRCLLDLL